jgi:hypothetical protein
MRKILLLMLVSILVTGCAGVPVQMSSPAPDPSQYQVLGEGEGRAVGIMLFNFIPIGQNDRFQRAYDCAVASKGGDKLLDPVISERWFWAYILNGYKTTVKGTVVKEKR